MKKFLISYDLVGNESAADYMILTSRIKELFSLWSRPVRSVWIVTSDKNASQIRDELMSAVDQNDKIIVVELTGNWASYNISAEVTEWLKQNI